MTDGSPGKARSHRSGYMHSIDAKQYETLFQLTTGTFKVPVKKRTRVHENARIRFYRNKHDFNVVDGQLLFQGKEIIVNNRASTVVQSQFKKNCGSGCRSMSHQLKDKYANLNEATIKTSLLKSKEYQRAYAKFTNHTPLMPILAKEVNERWQIDLIAMNDNNVKFEGKEYKWILSVLDIFSRFLMLRPLSDKRSQSVKHELSKLFTEHGTPDIIQCDQGGEFKGTVSTFLKKRGIKVARSSAYHPQSQGKCEVSHFTVRKKIMFKMHQSTGFNWAKDLHIIQEAINSVPKEVIGYETPINVFLHRRSRSLKKKAFEASQRCSKRMVNQHSKGKNNSIYKIGETVLIRLPKSTPKSRVPRRRYVREGKVQKRNLVKGSYLIQYIAPSGERRTEWFMVNDITSVTLEKERQRRTLSKKVFQKGKIKQRHRDKYLITKTHVDKVDELLKSNQAVRVLLDPKEDIGSCQFNCLADQLKRLSIHRTAYQLRQEAVNHLLSFEYLYRPFIEEDFTAYVTKLKMTTTYGDNLTLQALAREYNVQVLVLSNQGPEHTVFVSHTGIYDEGIALLTVGYFPEGQGEHYISVAVREDIQKNLLQPFLPENQVKVKATSKRSHSGTVEKDSNVDDLHLSVELDSTESNVRESDSESVQGDTEDICFSDNSPSTTCPKCVNNSQHYTDEHSEQNQHEETAPVEVNELYNLHLDVESSSEGATSDQLESTTMYDLQDGLSKEEESDSDSFQGDKEDICFSDNSPSTTCPKCVNDSQHYTDEHSEQNQHEETAPVEVNELYNLHLDVESSSEGATSDQLESTTKYDLQDGLSEKTPGNHEMREYLPKEIQRKIILISLQNDPSTRFNLQRVNSFFNAVVQSIPAPKFHIGEHVLQDVPNPVSVRRLYMSAGRGSGLALAIRRTVNDRRWWGAWLYLRQDILRNFELTGIWYRQRD